MDNPTTSLFQGPDIKINNSQNNEEEEDLEDQKRRKEELQNLLTAALDDFNYDESTVNSSTNISVASFDDLQQNYRQASEPNEQLKVLYDVRCRELSKLKEEYDNYKVETKREVDHLKTKLFLSEAEIRQLRISFKNAEDLLVEKAGRITELEDTLNGKDAHIKNCEKTVENLHMDVCAYQSTINELQLKLQGDANPFNLGAKKFNSEELQKAHQAQIVKLEILLEEQTKTAKIFEKEKVIAQQELRDLLEVKNSLDHNNENTVGALTTTLDNAQQQCKDLIDVVDLLTKENKHLQDRLNEGGHSSLEEIFYQANPLSNETLLSHIEKLKKLLVDKSNELETLHTMQNQFNRANRDLVEYRQLKRDIYKKEFQLCDNKDHTTSLVLMQNKLQHYRETIEDKNQQILTLNSTNRDLQEKIEEMLLQTRNDINNLSTKYSLPQLEQMTEELRNAADRVKELQEKLVKSEERRLSLSQKLQKTEKKIDNDLKRGLDDQFVKLRKSMEKEKGNLENQIKMLQKEVEIYSAEIKNLKQYTEDLINENTKLKLALKDANLKIEEIETSPKTINDTDINKKECEELKQQLKNMETELKGTLPKLKEAQNKIKTLEETLEDLNSAKTLAEGETYSYQFQVRDRESQLEHANKAIKYFENEVENLNKILEEKDELINQLKQFPIKNELEQLKEELLCKENMLKICEEDKMELTDLLQKTKLQLEEAKMEVLGLQKEVTEVDDKAVRRNLEKELKEAENHLEQSKIEEGEVYETEQFKKCLQAELLKAELQLREDLQQEYLRKIKDIERKYKTACIATNELYEEHIGKMKKQEAQYREHFAKILADCAQKINEFENDKQNLICQINYLQSTHEDYKKQAAANEDSNRRVIKNIKLDAEKNVEEWKNWSKKFISNCLKIETISKTTRDNILIQMKSVDSEIAIIEKSYNDQLRKYLKND